MTLYTNTFEGGTTGTTVTTANSGGTSGTAFVAVSPGVSFSNAQAAHGTLSGTASTGTSYARFPDVSSNNVAARMYYYTGSLQDSYPIKFFANGAATTVLTLRLLVTGKMRVTDSATTSLHDSTVNYPTATWIRLEVYAAIGASATAGTVTFAAYAGDSTTPLDTFTTSAANLGTGAITQVQMGQVSASAVTYWMDDLALDSAASGLIGPWTAPAQASVRPATVTSNAGAWVNQGGAASLQAALADESDTTYAETPALTTGQSASFTTAFTPLSAGDVTVKVRHQASAASPTISRLYELLQGSTVIASATVNPLPVAWTDFSFTTTSPQTSAITDRTALAVRVTDTSA